MSITGITSAAGVCSLALAHLKMSPVVSLETPVDEGEKRCALVYHQTRRKVLRALPWNFAIKRATLSAVTSTPDFGFTHEYALPNDFLRYLSRHDVSGFRLRSFEADYEIENGFIRINQDTAGTLQIRYIYDHQDVPKWDPMFIDLMSYEIAIRIGPNFQASASDLERLSAERKNIRAEAGAIDGQERPPKRVQRSRWLQARRQGPSVAGTHVDFGP